MLHKSFIALFIGCLLSISVMLNLNYLLPVSIDKKLLVGLLVAFPTWSVALVMCYSSRTAKQAWFRCGVPLIASVFINAFYFIG